MLRQQMLGNHLHEADVETEELTKAVQDFVNTRFLYWLEVLSLLGQVNIGSQILELAREYAQVSGLR